MTAIGAADTSCINVTGPRDKASENERKPINNLNRVRRFPRVGAIDDHLSSESVCRQVYGWL